MAQQPLRHPPELREKTVQLLAQDKPIMEIAKTVGVAHKTVRRWRDRYADLLERMRERGKLIAARRFKERADQAVSAQLDAASDKDCRHGPQALRVVGELVGAIGKQDVHIGDVNIGSVEITDARQQLIMQATPAELRERLDENRRKLGLG